MTIRVAAIPAGDKTGSVTSRTYLLVGIAVKRPTDERTAQRLQRSDDYSDPIEWTPGVKEEPTGSCDVRIAGVVGALRLAGHRTWVGLSAPPADNQTRERAGWLLLTEHPQDIALTDTRMTS